MATDKDQIELTEARLNLEGLKEELEALKGIKNTKQDQLALVNKIREARQKLNELQLKGYNYSRLDTEELSKKLKAMENIASLEDEREQIRSAIFRKKKEQVEEELENLKNADNLNEKSIVNKQKELKELEKTEESYNDIAESQKNLGNNFTKMVSNMGIQISKANDSFFVSFAKSAGGYIGSIIAGFTTFSGVLKGIFGGFFSGGFLSIIRNIGSLILKVLSVPAEAFLAKLEERFTNLVRTMTEKMPEFGKATGLDTEVFKKQVSDLAGVNAEYGFTVEKVTAATTELAASMSIFSKMTDMQRTAFINSTMFAENFGIANQTSMKILEDLNTVLNKTVTQSDTTYNYLQRVALGAGIPPSKLAKDLESALPKLAVQGNKMIEVFVGLSRQAKHLNVEVNDLLGLVDKFDTFEGAAESAGKLNAILGGDYLNSLQMINATEEERVMLIRQGLQQAGLQFDSLGKYQKLAVANALGIQDMSKASKILSGSTSDLNASLMGTAETQEIYNKRAEANAKLTDKLSAAFDKLAPIAIGVANALGSIVDFFAELGTGGIIAGAILSLAVIIGGAIATFMFMKKQLETTITESVSKAAERGAPKAPTISSASTELEDKIPKGKEPGSSTKTFFTNVAEGLKKLGDPLAYQGAKTFAIMVLSFTASILILSKSIEGFNKATAGGIFVMVVTMGALVAAMFGLSKFMGTFAKNSAVLIGLAVMAAIVIAMHYMSLSIERVSNSLVKLNDVSLKGLGSLSMFLASFTGIGLVGTVGSIGLYMTAKAIDTLAESLSNLQGLDGDNMLKISYSVKEITSIPKMENEKIQGVERVLKAVSDYQVTITNAKVDTSAQTQFLEQVANVMSEAVKLINGKPVNIKIDQSGNSFSIRSPNP